MDSIRIIKIFEDRQKKLCLSEEEKKDIMSMKSIIGENNLILQNDGKLLIKHYVGFIQINKTRLLIYPKIASRLNNEEGYDKAFELLIKLLSYSEFESVKKIPSSQMTGRYHGDLLEVFIGLFIDELLFLFKRDVNRGYKTNMENQTFIKGKIDFAETVKRNSYRKHLHYVRFDQFTENILLNQIFKAVIQRLIKRTLVKENKIKLKQGLLWLEDVEPIQLSNEIWNQVKFTRLNYAYEPVLNLAKLFYFNSSPNLNKGDELTFSFLVPLNQLFEKYIYEILKKNVSLDFEVKYQGPISYLGEFEGDKFLQLKLQLKPDICLLKGDKVFFVIDAKYKEVLSIDGKLSINQSDVYQMLAYSIRYDCKNIFLVYPKFLTEKDDKFLISKINIPYYDGQIVINVILIDLEKDTEHLSERLLQTIIYPEMIKEAKDSVIFITN